MTTNRKTREVTDGQKLAALLVQVAVVVALAVGISMLFGL